MMYVYMLTNQHNTVLYTGVTNDIIRRVSEHRNHAADGFTARYNVSKLVHVETFPDPVAAIAREKQLKGWTRAKKNALIETGNPQWRDLWPELAGHAE
ncbi:excinuclease ABC subunit C [Bifidobacterium sp. DSM 109958]|uniref:Excinuclease ABC subunit C n=1 Tax=Bifidobacterium moraviense TaxID=2675323 RepID=A0A7Y0F3A4_9BIFI|nr:GIY-YIG nuclease family protein [Bifidobacterium sp. DSM 109958]NMN01250.1 excinuclease ABC subunit C [Bifidobacterium sp. DSM 109958]